MASTFLGLNRCERKLFSQVFCFEFERKFDSSRFTPNLKQRFWWWVSLGIDDCSELKWALAAQECFSGFQERTVGNRKAESPKK